METTNRRPRHQFYVGLEAEVADALTAAAVREDRPGKAQAAHYIVDGLRRAGYLPPDDMVLAREVPGRKSNTAPMLSPDPDPEPVAWRAVKP